MMEKIIKNVFYAEYAPEKTNRGKPKFHKFNYIEWFCSKEVLFKPWSYAVLSWVRIDG